MTSYIPFHVPSIGEEEIEEVAATLRSGWLTTGARTSQFEREFAEYIGARHAVAVNSCTAAIHLALASIGIGPGDEVITTPLTFCATVNTILHVGATPVLADIDSTGNLDPRIVSCRVTSQTRALLPVHYSGLPCDMTSLSAIARQHSLSVVEDAAHAVGAEFEGVPIGSARAPYSSDAACFSFYATKNITTGEGGMVTTNDDALAEKIRILCLHGISKDAWGRYSQKGLWFYQVLEAGFKYNLSDIQSAIGIHQLHRLTRFAAAREHLAERYKLLLNDVEEIELPPEAPAGRRHAWHLYVIRLRLNELAISRDAFIDRLRDEDIGVSVHFIPIMLHPYFRKWAHLPSNACPQAIAWYERAISLPLYPALREDQQDRVVAVIKQIVHASRIKRAVAVGERHGETVSQVPTLTSAGV